MGAREPNVRATFSGEPGNERISISIVGDPNVFVDKVSEEYKARFADEWGAFNNGKDEFDPGGTPLTDVPGLTADIAKAYRLKGVRNVEELASLSDMAASRLGMNAITNRKNAQNMLKAKQADALMAATMAHVVSNATPVDVPVRRKPGRPPKVEETTQA